MRIDNKIGGVVLAALAVIACLFAAAGARAQEPLRWKLETGQKLNYNMVQDMTIGVAGGPLGEQNMTIHQVMNMIWNVVDAKEGGDALIRQKFDRVQTKMTMPPLGVIEYDSASDQAPVGLAAMLAPIYKALTEAEFELTMTPRGEIKDVKIPEKLIEALKTSPNAAALGDLATPDGFKKMMSQSALVLPENAPQAGEQSATKVELSAPGGGKQIVETTYRYDGTKDVDGVNCAVFQPTLKMAYEGENQPKIKEQESSGEILFNVEAGRLHSSKLDQKMTMEQGAGMQMKINQTIAVEVKPAE
jgi:uncharacterized protein DUF6263